MPKIYTSKELIWTNGPINVLGIDIANEEDRTIELNYDKLLQKAKAVIQGWTHRNLSLGGKILVINTLVASLFVYRMQVLPKIPEKYVNQLEKMIEAYIWNGHRPKIPLSTLQNVPQEGGMKLVHLRTKDMALKSCWVKLLLEGRYPSEMAYRILGIQEIGHLVWSCNLNSDDAKKLCNKENTFWMDVLQAWCVYHYTESDEDPEGNDEIIWLNSRNPGEQLANILGKGN